MSTNDSRPDPIGQVKDTLSEAKLASRKTDAFWAGRINTGRAYTTSLVLIVLLAAAQLLPHSDGVRGLDVLLWTDVAQSQETSLPSRIFVTLLSVGTVLGGLVMTLAQRWWAAGITWAATCIAAVYGVLAIWLRQSGRGPNPDFADFGGPGIGIYVSEVLVLALAISLSYVLWSKSEEQVKAENAVRDETQRMRAAAEAERLAEEKMARSMRRDRERGGNGSE